MSEQVKQRPPEPDWVWQNRLVDERARARAAMDDALAWFMVLLIWMLVWF